ncbi:MAG: hypothetical protein K5739_04630 [Lachnospiraceae bacterium]|nr:hypothetical protein [Lachnospiraceae bacterium]
MYIAIVADNIADRKQAERLLGRAGNTLSETTGLLYVSSYGDENAFLHECMKFDLFFLDFDNDIPHSVAVYEHFRELMAPGICCICKKETDTVPENLDPSILLINKPIMTADLHAMILKAHEEIGIKRNKETLIELRGDVDTKYVQRADLMYVDFDEEKRFLHYHLADGSILTMSGCHNDMNRSLGNLSEFSEKSRRYYVNSNFINTENKKSILLKNGERLSIAESSGFSGFFKRS